MKTVIEMAREAGFMVVHEGELEIGAWYECFTEEIERFAELVRADEREAIMDEWWMCVQSDLENGVKSLNERATEKWHKEYPAIAGFAAAIRARGEASIRSNNDH